MIANLQRDFTFIQVNLGSKIELVALVFKNNYKKPHNVDKRSSIVPEESGYLQALIKVV